MFPKNYTTKGKIVVSTYLGILLLVMIYSGAYVLNYATKSEPLESVNSVVTDPSQTETDQPLNSNLEESTSNDDKVTSGENSETTENVDEALDNSQSADDNNEGITDDGLTEKTYSEHDLAVLKEGNVSIYFDAQSFDISEDDKVTLQSFIEVVKRYPDEKIVVEGHSDGYPNFQNTAMEVSLAMNRIDSTLKYLAGNGIDVSNVITVNSGSSDPISRSKEDRSKNDRVDVYFLDHVTNNKTSK